MRVRTSPVRRFPPVFPSVAAGLLVSLAVLSSAPVLAQKSAADAPDVRASSQVSIEQNGRVVAVGVILDRDGRILTSARLPGAAVPKAPDALSSPDVTVQYANGSKIRGKIMHADAESGLAVVVPLEGRRTLGVKASSEDPVATPAHVLRGGKDIAVQLASGPGAFLAAAAAAPSAEFRAGTPLFDGSGAVLAVTVRQCTPADGAAVKPACGNAFAPVPVIRTFLSKMPPGATIPSAWLGIGGEALDTGAVRGVRVIAVAPNSPAAAAGLVAGADADKSDIILSVDGETVATPEALGTKISAHGVGDKAKLLVFRGNRLRDVLVVLKSAP